MMTEEKDVMEFENMPEEIKTALPNYFTLDEAAAYLGYASTGNLRTDCRTGKIPMAYKVGTTWVIRDTWVYEKKKEEVSPRGARGQARK